ncbi:dCTP pyrophosphatase 1, partial [Tanacetum coccineum]
KVNPGNGWKGRRLSVLPKVMEPNKSIHEPKGFYLGHGEAGIAAILAKGQLLRQLDMGPTIVLMGRAAINMAFMDTLGVTMVCSSIGMSANYGTQLDTLRVTMEVEFISAKNMSGVSEGEEIVTLKLLTKKMEDFAQERDWEKYHSPRNLLLALVGEVGELSEIFQWKGEVPKGLGDWKEEEKVHLGEELSDVLLYLVRLSDICGVDLGQAALRKIRLNAIKYPAPGTPNGNTTTTTTTSQQ